MRTIIVLLAFIPSAAFAQNTTSIVGSVGGYLGSAVSQITPTVYTASGAISPNDGYSLIQSSSATNMTLAAGVNGSVHTICNYGPAGSQVQLTWFGNLQWIPLPAGGVVNVLWNSTLSTYLPAS